MNKINTIALIFIASVFLIAGAYALNIKQQSLNSNPEIDMLRCRADFDDNGWVNIFDVIRIRNQISAYDNDKTYNIKYDLNRDNKIDLGDAHIVFAFWDERPSNCGVDNDKLGSEDWVTSVMTCKTSLTSDSIINAEDVFYVGTNSVDIDGNNNANKDDAYLVRGYEYGSTLHC